MAVLSKVANIAVQPQPVGVVEAFAGTNAPNGWLICDGSQVSRSLFPELFSVIGTTYGSGDGFATFTLPDLRGRTIAGRDGVNNMNNGPTNRLTSTHFGASGTALGNAGGLESNTLLTAQIPAHAHDVRSNIFGVENSVPVGDGRAQPATTSGWTWSVAGNAGANHLYTKNTGSGNAHNNTQPTIILNYIIKAVSELPRGGWYNSSSPDVVTSLPINPYVGQEVYHSISNNLYLKRYNGSTWDKTSNDVVICTSTTRPSIGIVTGQFIYETDTLRTLVYNGAGWVPTNSTQVYSATKTNTYSNSLLNTWTTIPDLSVTLTPQSSSSKFMIFAVVNGSIFRPTLNAGQIRIIRNSTPIGIATVGTYRASTSSAISSTDSVNPSIINHLDSPVTIASITYAIQIIQDSPGNPVIVNSTVGQSGGTNGYYYASNITVIEVL
jgi:microcystin-dependent protein